MGSLFYFILFSGLLVLAVVDFEVEMGRPEASRKLTSSWLL